MTGGVGGSGSHAGTRTSKRGYEVVHDLPDDLEQFPVALRSQGLPIGNQLGGLFLVVDRIGAGAEGAVYKVRRLNWSVGFRGRRFGGYAGPLRALKVRSGGPMIDKQRARFLGEAMALNRHRPHRGIVDFYGGWAWDSSVFMLLEYVDGKDLSALMKEGPVSLARALKIIEGAARALIPLSGKTLHRDLKPSNLAVDRHGRVRVLDFGCVRPPGVNGTSRPPASNGTPAYSPPEEVPDKYLAAAGLGGIAQFRGTQPGEIYSLAMTLLALLLGEHAVPEADRQNYATAFAYKLDPNGLPNRVIDMVAALPPKIDDEVRAKLLKLLTSATCPDPARRPASFSDFADRIAEIRRLMGFRRPIKVSRWVAVAAALTLLLGAGTAVALWAMSDESPADEEQTVVDGGDDVPLETLPGDDDGVPEETDDGVDRPLDGGGDTDGAADGKSDAIDEPDDPGEPGDSTADAEPDKTGPTSDEPPAEDGRPSGGGSAAPTTVAQTEPTARSTTAPGADSAAGSIGAGEAAGGAGELSYRDLRPAVPVLPGRFEGDL